jgi:Fusaric acid resistance protein family
LGACLGTLAGPWIGDRPWLFIPVMGLIGGIAVYRGNRSAVAYAWLLGGITALMVTFEAHLLESTKATATFALMRIVEVAVGTLSCLVISGAFDLAPRWYARNRASAALPLAPTIAPLQAPEAALDRSSLTLGMQGALAMALLAALTYVLRMPGLMQGMVTVVAVLILPQAALATPGRRPVVEKMTHRLIGCLLAGAVGLALLPLMGGAAVACMIALSLGVWVGCHVQTGREGATYIGRQFTIAFIMVFVQDHGWSADPGPALTRLSGILAGIVVLAAVMLTTRRLPGA